MSDRETPALVEHLPEPHLRLLGHRWKLGRFLTSARGQQYVDWLRSAEASLTGLYGYKPSANQLRRAVAASIVDEDDFLNYLVDTGDSRLLEDKEELENLALAAAGMMLALHRQRNQSGGPSGA